MKIRYLFMLLGLLTWGTQNSFAQTVVKAVVDNYIISPATTTTLNVLKNDEVSCHISDITLSIATAPSHGTAVARPNNTIVYRATNDYYGSDSFTYQIVCSGISSTATVHINSVGNQPDNMVPEVCAITPPAFDWKMAQTQKSPMYVQHARPWLVGDLGGGPNPEIVMQAQTSNPAGPQPPATWTNTSLNASYGSWINQVVIFRDGNLNDHKTFSVQGYCQYFSLCSYGLSKFANGKGSVVIAAIDGYLYGYEFDGAAFTLTQKWKSSAKYIHPAITTAPAGYSLENANILGNGPSIGFADFNKDGVPEIYVGNKIFDLETGSYLCGGDNIHRGFSVQNNTAGFGSMLSVAVDYNLDGATKLVCGNAIYKPTYNSATDTWTNPKIQTVTPPTVSTGAWQDGHVSLVDLNNDGYPDAVVQTLRRVSGRAEVLIYGWDMKNNKILFRYHKTGAATAADRGVGTRSVAFIGDLDGDGKPEIAFIEESVPQVSRDAVLRAFKLPTTFGATASLVPFWAMDITEAGGRTGISLFDFNLDGISEVIYRDETHLRIIDGSLKKQSTPYNLAAVPSVSSTTWEMPVVADIDGDGAAEIICGGAEDGSLWGDPGYLKIYKSGNSSAWAPARKVWNQYGYNPTFVNEDLTIPRYPINMGSYYYGADGVTRRPYNNFLQQAPIMTGEGVSLHVAPNLMFQSSYQPTLSYNEVSGAATISCSVYNDGDLPFKGPITLQLYTYDEVTTTYTKIGAQQIIGNASSTLAMNANQICSYSISNFQSLLPTSYSSWFLVINSVDAAPNAPTFFYGMKECIEADNATSSLSLVREERVMCKNAIENIKLDDVYAYKWYTSLASTTPVATEAEGSHVLKHTKDNNLVEYYFVETYAKSNLTKPISSVRDTIFVYLTPDSLIWTGATNGDWHNPTNWENPNDVFNQYPKANVPRPCTSVLINDGLTVYPSLDSGVTSYAKYDESECDNVHFKHGGEISSSDMLVYTNAFVEVDMPSNRWVMFSPPLKHLYSGDVYVNDKNPYIDDVFVGTRLFAQKNPQTGYNIGSWTGKYNNPDVSFKAGEGLAVWLDDKDQSYDPSNVPHDPFLIKFPKYTEKHHIYDPWGVPEKDIPVVRGLEHRFIFDGLPHATTKNFDVVVSDKIGEAVGGDKYVLVGNPFMAHLDFAKFYAANSTAIYDSYQVMDENGDTKTYAASGGTLERNIAPMQSFLVRLKYNVASLVMNGEMTTNVPGYKLRATQEENEEEILFINLANANTTKFISSASVILKDEAKNSYNAEEDVPKLLFTYDDYTLEPSGLYTQSLDDNKIRLAINTLKTSSDSLCIPLGIRSVKANQGLAFFITGQWNFASGKSLYLYDKLEQKHYDLRSASWFNFNNVEGQPYLDRFEIQVGVKNASGIEENVDESSISIIGSMNAIYVESDSNIQDVKVYDLQGRLVVSKTNQGDRAKIEQLSSGVYIVEVVTATESTVKKVFVY